jgi:hypothetical protein
MFERERKLYDFLLGYARRLVADVDDARFADQPAPGLNHPAWLLGHMAVVSDVGLGLLGRPRETPRLWKVLFGTASTPRADRDVYPSKDELWSAYESGHQRLTAAVVDAAPEAMEAPHPVDFLKPGLATVGDLVAHILTTHEALHLGQLSSWRRHAGLSHLF